MTRFDTRIPTESEEQQSLFRYCRVELGRHPDLIMLAHIPNEGKRTKTTGARLKAEGLRPGFPDISLSVPRRDYHGLYIELKRIKGSTKTQDQKEWIINLNKRGYAAAFCYGWCEAWEFIHAYLTCNSGNHDYDSIQTVEHYRQRSIKEAMK